MKGIRLVVLYNLSPGTGEEEFLKWQLGKHQDSNLAIEGVVRADFARIDGAWPEGTPPRYRFMTTLDWPDMQSFEKGFHDPGVQASMRENVKMLDDPIFLISEVLIEAKKEA